MNKPKSDTLILGVMIAGGPYGELTEQRIRSRVAVLEGLSRCGFQPDDEDHIGYIEIPWIWTPLATSTHGNSITYPQLSHFVCQSDPGIMPLVIPYEWCRRTSVPLPGVRPLLLGRNDQLRDVLVLWLNEDAVRDYPLMRLASIFQLLRNPDFKADSPIMEIIGPNVSTTLRAMVDETVPDNTALNPAVLKGVRMYSPTASADDVMLAASGDAKKGDIDTDLSSRIKSASGLTFLRTTFTDDRICRELFDELSLRCGTREGSVGQVAIVSEWDTFYGRALPITFAAAASQNWILSPPISTTRPSPILEQEERRLLTTNGAFPSFIHTYFYLRGIDGQAPGELPSLRALESSIANSNEKNGGAFKFEGPIEAPEGVSQLDYLRRLADELSNLDTQLRNNNKGGLEAIIIAGTDPYDKLLILRALRDRLPGKQFFTVDLDARYTLATEWHATHNLISISSFGLTLHPYFQGNVAPFRDSNQTAIFACTLLAVMNAVEPSISDADIKTLLGRPRRFEISRSGAYDLSIDNSGCHSDMSFVNDPATKPGIIHPFREDYAVGSFFPLRQLFFLASISLFLFIIYKAVQTKPFTRKDWIPIGVLAIGGILVYMALAICPRITRAQGDPLTFFAGISIWPTEALRCMTASLCIYYISKSLIDVNKNHKDLQEMFKLVPLRNKPNEYETLVYCKGDAVKPSEGTFAISIGNKWDVYGKKSNEPRQEWAIRASEDDPQANVYAQNLWWEYCKRAGTISRVLRVLIASITYMLVICAYLYCRHNLPNSDSPARGSIGLRIDQAVLTVSVACSILLVFFCLDAAILNRAVMRLLSKTTTFWPHGTFDVFKEAGEHFADLTEYLDIRFIAVRTRIIGDLVYYPFIIFSLMIFSRSSLFDNWNWPPDLLAIFGANFMIAIAAAMGLRIAAENARNRAIQNIRSRQRQHEAANRQNIAKLMERLLCLVEDEREGAFSVLSRHPLIAAALLPSASIGLWLLVEYMAKPT